MSTDFFDDVNNVNIFGFTKTVVNYPKLKDDLVREVSCGDKFDYFVGTSDKVKLYYTEALTQMQIDNVNNLMNNFVESSLVDTLADEQTSKSADGFSLYKFIIADINSRGGLGTIDGGITQYLGMTNIRHMLKDGFFEYALRFFVLNLAPAFTQEQQDLYMSEMERLALKYSGTTGTTQAELDAIKTAPQGQV